MFSWRVLWHASTWFGFRCVLKVERRIDLVYGGGSVGLMGLVSQAVHDGGRHVLGFVLTHSPFSVVHVIYIIGHLNHFCWALLVFYLWVVWTSMFRTTIGSRVFPMFCDKWVAIHNITGSNACNVGHYFLNQIKVPNVGWKGASWIEIIVKNSQWLIVYIGPSAPLLGF